MLMVVSPAKALDESHVNAPMDSTEAEFLKEAEILAAQLKKMNPHDIGDLMSLSEKLAELNYERYQDWSLPMKSEHAFPAGYLFKGDVYQGMDIRSLNSKQVAYLQSHLRILSGLYGILKPMDRILPYRLEMGTHLKTSRGKNLYEFWGDCLVNTINQQLEDSGSKVLVNLASNEYFKAIGKKKLKGNLITPQFKDWKNGQYKMISFYAKKARGLMARYAALNQVENVEDLKYFDAEGYAFAPNLSNEKEWVFTRKQD